MLTHMITFRAAMTRKGELESRQDYVRSQPVRFVPINTGQVGKK
jgi:hypothetical protein